MNGSGNIRMQDLDGLQLPSLGTETMWQTQERKGIAALMS